MPLINSNKYVLLCSSSLAHFSLSLQAPRSSRQISGSSSVPNSQHPLKIVGKRKRLQVKAAAEIYEDALLSKISTSSIIASSSTQPDSSVHGEKRESALNHKATDATNSDESLDLLNSSRPVPIKKYETVEDESFFEQVHFDSMNA